MIVARQMQIDLITGEFNPIVDWFIEAFSDLVLHECDIFHKKGGEVLYFIPKTSKWIFYQDNDRKILYCNSKHYYKELNYLYNMQYKDIYGISKILIENIFNREVSATTINFYLHNEKIYRAMSIYDDRIILNKKELK